MRYGLIGEKLGHSFSVPIHRGFGNDTYELKEIPKDGVEEFLKERDFLGINVTIPYKQTVIPYCETDEAAEEIGAVNTVVNRDGTLYGYNTDAYGMAGMMDRACAGKSDLTGEEAVILGAGGTAKTAIYVLKKKKAARITLLVRNVEKARREMKEKGVDIVPIDHPDKDVCVNAGILMNTTPVGMFPNTDNTPVDLDLFPNLKYVFDVIYNPLNTRLVQEAKKRGLTAACGLYMLVLQAMRAEELFGLPLRSGGEEVYEDLWKDRQNIVLIGMPGSGKSTVGRILAEELHKEFFDTDEVFTEEYKITPGDCITKEGEDAFRLKETEVVRKTAMTGGRVIATGGGVVCRRINTEFLKQNGFMVYLKRDLEHLSTQGRPLSNGTDAVKNLYEKRKSLYENSADCAVENREEDILFTVKEIKEAYENTDH